MHLDSAFLHIFILRPALWIGGGQSYWWRDLRFALCTLQFCSVAFFLHVSPCPRWVVGGAIGDTGATTQQREGERGGGEGSSRKSKRFKGTGGPEVLWRQLTLCGAASLPPIFGGCSSDLSQEGRWVIKDPQTFDSSSQKRKRWSI